MSNDSKPNVEIEITEVNYSDESQIRDLIIVLNAYSEDPMGNERPLQGEVKNRLKIDLPLVPGAFSFLAYQVDNIQRVPAGLINCFMGYSTFKAKPLVNIHDIVVMPGFRGQSIGEQLLKAVETKARNLGCCKITLEVRTDNPAERLYRRQGFTDGDNTMIFLTKPL